MASTAKDAVLAFLLASLGTIAGTLVAWKIVGHLLGPEGYKVRDSDYKWASVGSKPLYFEESVSKQLETSL